MNIFNKIIIGAGLIIFIGITLDIIGQAKGNNILLIIGLTITGFIIAYTIFIVPRLLNKKHNDPVVIKKMREIIQFSKSDQETISKLEAITSKQQKEMSE